MSSRFGTGSCYLLQTKNLCCFWGCHSVKFQGPLSSHLFLSKAHWLLLYWTWSQRVAPETVQPQGLGRGCLFRQETAHRNSTRLWEWLPWETFQSPQTGASGWLNSSTISTKTVSAFEWKEHVYELGLALFQDENFWSIDNLFWE